MLFFFYSDDGGGIEMQVLGGSSGGGGGGAGDSSGAGVNVLAISSSTEGTSTDHNLSNGISQANSAISIDYPEQVASTIGKLYILLL